MAINEGMVPTECHCIPVPDPVLHLMLFHLVSSACRFVA